MPQSVFLRIKSQGEKKKRSQSQYWKLTEAGGVCLQRLFPSACGPKVGWRGDCTAQLSYPLDTYPYQHLERSGHCHFQRSFFMPGLLDTSFSLGIVT